MTQVDFYILPQQSTEDRRLFACRLIDKAFKLGHNVYIHCQSDEQAKTIDELLWSFQASAFLPHQVQNPANSAQVEIGYGQDPGDHHDVLINLGLTIPDFFSRFQRVSEIVVSDPEVTEATRDNYKFYRDRGYPLQSHDMRK